MVWYEKKETMTSSTKSSPLLELLSPDGYYTYLGIQKPPIILAVSSSDDEKSNANKIDEESVKKNYRKLSLRHHPDKPGGDADTFRLLNRAQRVLMNEKLRQQYDILGIDLDDDEADNNTSQSNNNSESNATQDERPSTAQGIVHEIAATILSGIIQLGVRTLMIGLVATFVVRFWWTVYPGLVFLGFVGYRILKAMRTPGNGNTYYDLLSPLVLAFAVLLMHYGRVLNPVSAVYQWTWLFWIGESCFIGMFMYNSLTLSPGGLLPAGNPFVIGIVSFVSILLALWFRGKVWNYFIILCFIAFAGLFTALAFPIMELVLESILNEKLKLVGEKVRHHHSIMKQHYEKQLTDSRK